MQKRPTYKVSMGDKIGDRKEDTDDEAALKALLTAKLIILSRKERLNLPLWGSEEVKRSVQGQVALIGAKAIKCRQIKSKGEGKLKEGSKARHIQKRM